MIVEILSTGNELMTGALIDTNAAYISQMLLEFGIEVHRQSTIGDNYNNLVLILQEISQRADMAIVTGGLGPTLDDLTSEAAAKAKNVALVLDIITIKQLESFFKKLGREMDPSNKKQALLPATAERLDNPIGTAPGFMLKINHCLFFFMPGVPREMKKMLREQVIPRISSLTSLDQLLIKQTLVTIGMSESKLGAYLKSIRHHFPELEMGTCAVFPEIQIILYARGQDKDHLHAIINNAIQTIKTDLGHYVISQQGDSLETIIGQLLNQKNATLAVAESCTGGLIGHWITSVPGSSAYFVFSGVTYSNDAKINVLGVSSQTLQTYGAVSEETVCEMALGARKIANTTYAIAISGIAGPGGGTETKPVGTVCIGIQSDQGSESYRYYLPYGERAEKKLLFAKIALECLRRHILNYEPLKF